MSSQIPDPHGGAPRDRAEWAQLLGDAATWHASQAAGLLGGLGRLTADSRCELHARVSAAASLAAITDLLAAHGAPRATGQPRQEEPPTPGTPGTGH